MLGGLNCRALIVCYAPRRASATSPRLTSTAHYLPVVSVTSCATKSDSELLIICDVASRSSETNINSLFLFFFASYSSAHINYSGIKKRRPKGERGLWVWRMWLKRPGQQSCHVNRFIWIMQAGRKERRKKKKKRERCGMCCVPSIHVKARSQEPQSVRVSCPQTMTPQMNEIFVPWHFNPRAAWCLCRTAEDYFRGFFHLFIMSGMVKTVSSRCVNPDVGWKRAKACRQVHI